MQYSNPYSNPYSNHYSKILESGLESANENTLNSQNSEIITDSKDYENYGSKMSSEYTRLGFIVFYYQRYFCGPFKSFHGRFPSQYGPWTASNDLNPNKVQEKATVQW